MVDDQHLAAGVGEFAQRTQPVTLGMSTVTTRSASRRITVGSTSSRPPGSDRRDSGSSAGAAKLTSTLLPALSSTSARARPAPMVSASGYTWHTTLIEAADASRSDC